MLIEMKPVGYIESPYKTREEIPSQSIYSRDKRGIIHLEAGYRPGLEGYKEGDFIVLIFAFHQSDFRDLLIKPHGRQDEVGVFRTRSPNRPNPIGMSIVEISQLEGDSLEFIGVDMLDGSPVLDIKPYSPDLNPDL